MTDLRKAAEMALDAMLSEYSTGGENKYSPWDVIEALRQALAQTDETETLKRCLFQMQEAAKALAQPEQERLSLRLDVGGGIARASAACGDQIESVAQELPKREWVGLTEEEREQATGWSVEHIEAALRSKNNG